MSHIWLRIIRVNPIQELHESKVLEILVRRPITKLCGRVCSKLNYNGVWPNKYGGIITDVAVVLRLRPIGISTPLHGRMRYLASDGCSRENAFNRCFIYCLKGRRVHVQAGDFSVIMIPNAANKITIILKVLYSAPSATAAQSASQTLH